MTRTLSSNIVRTFQDIELAKLRDEPYAQLVLLPRSRRIKGPPDAKGIEFWIEKREGECGGVRIEVRACKRALLIFLSCACRGFEKLPDDSVVEEPVAPED